MKYKDFTNRADLLEAAAHSIRMQEAAGIEPCYKYGFDIAHCLASTGFHNRAYDGYEFPLAVIEGKPVFEGNELYSQDLGRVKVIGAKRFQDTKDIIHVDCGSDGYVMADKLSWDPQKPKTVMVEMLVEDAEWMVRAYDGCNSKAGSLAASCREALDNIK